MIVICACGAKLKIDDEKITTSGVKIICPKCGNPHLVKKPTPGQRANELSMPSFASSMNSIAKPLILIAHDSKVVADMIEQVVSEAGYGTAHAPDGLEALRKATELKPQVMIVDVGLTGIYGFELCERLKGNPETRDIKIILLSSVYGLTAYKRSPATLYGADDYIEKHHIPDKLVIKIKQLLSGKPRETPQFPQASEPVTAVHDRTVPEKASHRASPLVRRKGLLVDASVTTEAMNPSEAPDARAELEREIKPVIPEFPDVMPKVPITLDGGRKQTIAPMTPEAAARPPKTEEVRSETVATPTAPKTKPAPTKASIKAAAPLQDGSVTLDATFFEHEEYAALASNVEKSTVNPEEIEKARRFARLIVSDIALYNQDLVAEGLRKGTFFDLLQEDITEGRLLYDDRVPQAIRKTKDYYQEAFDDFIASKKNQR